MQSSKAFGRRASSSPLVMPPIRKAFVRVVPERSEPAPLTISPADTETPSLDDELQDWKQERKNSKRTFREPWRTVTIAASVGFFAVAWILPDDVANIAQLALGVLTLGAVIGGLRSSRA